MRSTPISRDDLVARARRVVRGDDRRAGEEPRRARRGLHLLFERERPRVPLPARERRLELLGQIRAHVQPARARPAAQPLHRAADAERDLERSHVERHRARRLVRVEAHVGAHRMCLRCNRLDRLDLSRLVEHVRHGNEQRALVDRLDHRLGVRAHDDLCTEPRPRLLDVAHRREQTLLEDDPVSRRLQVEAREDDRLGNGHVLVHDRRARRRADDPADEVADAKHRVPPAFPPRARAARPPLGRELRQAPLRLGRHRAERVVDQVRRRLEDREAIPVAPSAPRESNLQAKQLRAGALRDPRMPERRQHGDRAAGRGLAGHHTHRRGVDDDDLIGVDARHPELLADDRRAERVARHLRDAGDLQRRHRDSADDVRLL